MEVLRGPSPARSASTQLLVGPGWQEQSGSWAGGCGVEEEGSVDLQPAGGHLRIP